MTPSEFAKSIRAKHPGTYDDMDDESLTSAVLKKYPQYNDLVTTTPAGFPEPQVSDNPSAGAEVPAEQRLLNAGDALANGYFTGQLVGGGLGLAGKAASAIGDATGISDAAAKVGDMVGNGADALKAQITGNTPRAFGYAQNAGATPEARELANSAIDFANKPQPELGQLVSDASQTPAPDVSTFNNPIKTGMFGGDPEAMLQTVETQKQAVGKAIENTLAKYDANGSYYDPTALNNQVKSMMERDANGQIMTTGPQGEINQAIDKAIAGLRDYSQGDPIKWSDAARIKTLLQGDASFGQQGLTRAQQAYDAVATMLKNDIDSQAAKMLQEKGGAGDVQSYQQLRDAYGKLASLGDSLNVASKRQFANSAIPWWVKMGAGAALGSMGARVLHGLTGN